MSSNILVVYMSSSFTSKIRWSRRNFRHAAFTLTELLVVMATIAILVATLLPVLARTQAKTQLTQCLNNLHQFGLAIQMYGNDNQDYLPAPNWGVSAGQAFNVGWLYTPFLSAPPRPSPSKDFFTNFTAQYYQSTVKGSLWNYINNVGTYWCPADNPTNSGSTWPQRANQLSTYIMNSAVIGYGDNPNFKGTYKITDIKQKQAVILWEPNDRDPGGSYIIGAYNDGANYPNATEGPGLLHNPGSDLLYLDGHVTFMPHTTAVNLMATNGPNEFWWDPDQVDGH
jgi:prepilin-type processing-associated H-X9-DG protein